MLVKNGRVLVVDLWIVWTVTQGPRPRTDNGWEVIGSGIQAEMEDLRLNCYQNSKPCESRRCKLLFDDNSLALRRNTVTLLLQSFKRECLGISVYDKTGNTPVNTELILLQRQTAAVTACPLLTNMISDLSDRNKEDLRLIDFFSSRFLP